MTGLEYTMCIIELWPATLFSMVLSFSVGLIVGFVLCGVMQRPRVHQCDK